MTQQNRKEFKTIMLFVLLFGTSLISMMIFTFGAEQTYTIGVQRGTDVFEVITYNEIEWNTVVGAVSPPDAQIGGDAETLGAKSKITIRSVDDVEWGTYDSLSILFNVLDPVPDDAATLIAFTQTVNFTEEYLNTTYTNTYNAAVALASEWIYSAEAFEETPDNSFKLIPVLKDPTKFSEALADYNNWSNYVNNLPTWPAFLVATGMSNYTNYTGEEFLMKLIYDEIAVGTPVNDYLTAMVKDLNCTNVTVDGNSLIIQKVGIENYTIEVSFSDQGTISSYVVKNLEGTIIYEIALNVFDDIILMVVELSIVIGIAGIVILSIRRKKKIQKI